MNLVILIVGTLLLVVVVGGLGDLFMRPRRRMVDKDADGAPDEPGGPAKDL